MLEVAGKREAREIPSETDLSGLAFVMVFFLFYSAMEEINGGNTDTAKLFGTCQNGHGST